MKGPLDPPAGDATVLGLFLDHFGLRLVGDTRTDLEQIARAFARIPYENLTKIVRRAESYGPSLRTPAHVVSDHQRHGAGGTCFSLAATLLYLARSIGAKAEPILADRRYGPNTHAAILAWIEGRPHLIDPGYLITTPVSLEHGSSKPIDTSFNEVRLTSRGGGKLDLSTSSNGELRYRLTFRTDPADPAEFLQAWKASFDWDMMHYPLLTRIVDGEQIYLQKQRLQIRTKSNLRTHNVAMDDLAGRITRDFGMSEPLVRRALAILQESGDLRDG